MLAQKQRKRQEEQRRRIDAERWQRRRQLRERLRRLKDLANLLLLIRLLDAAKELGAALGASITANLSRPRHNDETDQSTKIDETKQTIFEHSPAPRSGVYNGRYFGRRPHLSDLIRDLSLPGPNGDEAFAELLKQLPDEVHDWARVMFAESHERAFKSAIRNNRVGAAEAIVNMQIAARRWQWEQEKAIRAKKMELEKKFNRDREANEEAEYNPRM